MTRVPFGQGSWTQTEVNTWEMWYPWPPFHVKYEKEPGLLIHLSKPDAQNVVSAIAEGASFIGILTQVGAALSVFSGVVGAILSHLVRNPDGSMDIHIAPHGFQVGQLPSADPNVWVDGAWAPVAAVLWRLPRPGVSMLAAAPKFEIPPPHAASRGRFTSFEG